MTAPPLILHHHDPSPFAEKIRVAFGIKHLAWRSVLIPMIMPKPDLTALTGGYRGTPVLQIGADIYCDSRLIMEVIEELFPSPPLLKSGPLPNFGLQHWSDETLFPPGAALAMHENRAQLPDALIADREAYFADLEFGSFARDARHFHAQFSAHAADKVVRIACERLPQHFRIGQHEVGRRDRVGDLPDVELGLLPRVFVDAPRHRPPGAGGARRCARPRRDPSRRADRRIDRRLARRRGGRRCG